ncbi:MAG: sigma-70 family RNA polymerase sigma factor [Lachnospiraceae bacterium]|nr:sigma-70 family RNA polymerase sigma factor [Lachnospiraceae bacterium]
MFCFKHFTKEQFADCWEASREKYYRLAYCYTKNEQDALDILSEATYKGYCHLHQLRQPEYFDTWMSRIIIFEACHFLKQKKRWVPYEEYMEAPSENMFREVEKNIDVYRCLDKLSAEDRTLLILKYFEERSFKEISEILSVPENTVKTKTYRLLKKIREEESYGD